MIITKKALPRRTFLKGAQAALALPLLDAMIPAATAWAKTPAKPVPRLSFVYIPMGCDHARWTPPGQEKLTELSPILHPLESVKDHVTVITNTRLQNSYPGTHDTSNSGFLSAAFSKHTESSDYYLGTTIDQIAAKQIGRETQLPSLELAMDLNPLAGVCNNGYACVYHELSLLVFADDPAPLRSASAHCLRAPLWRGRQRGRTARGAPAAGRACSIRSAETSRGSNNAWAYPIAFASISISRAFARSSGRSSVPRQARWTTTCPMWTGRSAFPRHSPTTRS